MSVTDGDRERAADWIESVLDNWVGAFDHSNDEARDRVYVLTELAAAFAGEREKARAPFLALIEEEVAEAQERGQFYAVSVEIPMAVGTETIDRIFEAVADAAYEAQPEQRDWDVFVHGHGPAHQSVPLHFIRRAAEEAA